MAHEKKLPPWELIEEILSRVPPQSLVRFRTVSKQWNSLFNDKTFNNNHKTTFRFILSTKSKMYSVSINPKIEVRELTLDIPGLEPNKIPKKLIDFNGFMLCGMDKETLVWNPWLKQTRRIKLHVGRVDGIGYDDFNRSYKILAFFKELNSTDIFWKIGDFDSDVWRSRGVLEYDVIQVDNPISLASRSVLLDGYLYWVGSYEKGSMFCLMQFDFSIKKLYIYCDLSCCGDQNHHALVLEVFNGDRFSLLKQCRISKKIEIWVTKNKIHKLFGRGKDVEWMNIMQVSIPNLPFLNIESRSPPSYFIDDEYKRRLVVCSCDETGQTWIYVFGDKKLISKTQLVLVVDLWPLHRTFFPTLVSVHRQPQIVKSWKEVLLGSLRS